MTTGLAEAARAVKEAKRAANRAAWARDPRNANVQREQMLETVVVPEALPAPVPVDTSSLGRLRAIMANPTAPLFHRLDAAECVLAYELAPAALASLSQPEEAGAASYRFLRAVANAAETPPALQLRALKCLSSIENARAPKLNPDQHREKLELYRHLKHAERRKVLADAGRWPPSGDDLLWLNADQPDPPDGWLGSGSWPPTDIAARLDKLSKRRRMAK